MKQIADSVGLGFFVTSGARCFRLRHADLKGTTSLELMCWWSLQTIWSYEARARQMIIETRSYRVVLFLCMGHMVQSGQ